MSTSQYDFLVELAKTSLPSLFVFILGWAVAAWWIGDSHIALSNPVPLIVASTSSLVFLGIQWLWKEKTSWGFWSQSRWEDPFRNSELEGSTDYGKFTWKLQIREGETSLVAARCIKCKSMALLDTHTKKRKVRVICSRGCFRQKMLFKGTKSSVMEYISRQVFKLLAENERAANQVNTN